jgi:hypothetical protein
LSIYTELITPEFNKNINLTTLSRVLNGIYVHFDGKVKEAIISRKRTKKGPSLPWLTGAKIVLFISFF